MKEIKLSIDGTLYKKKGLKLTFLWINNDIFLTIGMTCHCKPIFTLAFCLYFV